jgi:uncharacterized protein YjbI with pentapeptide repeats
MMVIHGYTGSWRGSVTFFGNFSNTQSASEHKGMSWNELQQLICGELTTLINKKCGKTFVPCLLKEAELSGATLEKAVKFEKATIGKMRSKAHMTSTNWLVLDFDGVDKSDIEAILAALDSQSSAYFTYTTFSQGNPQKKGEYRRLVIPLDIEVTPEEYTSVWQGFNQQQCKSLADTSGANLCQAQAVYISHPDWSEHASKAVSKGSKLTQVKPLLELGQTLKLPEKPSKEKEKVKEKEYDIKPDANLIADKCAQIRQFRDEKGASQHEPLWLDSLGIVIHCENGEKLCHDWSSGHSGYKELDTDNKMLRRKKFPPTTCAQFFKTNHQGCDGCDLIVNSPIALGYPTVTGKNIPKPEGSKQPLIKSTSRYEKITPHAEPVRITEVAEEISTLLKQFVIMEEYQAVVLTFWIIFTWFIGQMHTAPILMVNAPERACGKTQLMELLNRLVCRPLLCANLSVAYLFREMDQNHPTLLVDEADTFIKEQTEMKGIINAGYSREGAFVGRTSMETYKPEQFDLFGAKAFAGIGLERHFPESTLSRSYIINLRRKLADEKVERLRYTDPAVFSILSAKLARVAQDYHEAIASMGRVEFPASLDDRSQDNLEPLYHIALLANDEWAAKLLNAATTMTFENADDKPNQLLVDIKSIFEETGKDKISSGDLIVKLNNLPDSPWVTYNRGKEMSQTQLAQKLKSYHIKTKNLRINGSTKKCYLLDDFKVVFDHYL